MKTLGASRDEEGAADPIPVELGWAKRLMKVRWNNRDIGVLAVSGISVF